ncbi:AAA family ATPase [Pseudoduganella violacea]|uniref:Putative ATP-binding protein involved in virulence n=1 Tax=Pseudoduganella violacea TaxID=1715466 RepID=A0A7W5B8U6_9BURK|nr:AAA family ATPase [Pseudoduganella violacea]MBB3118692.1 putative ATP-binding protein involved in virulence [Pseudoduganella violacea]
MRLKQVTLNNYRCFQHLEVNLHPRLTVFVGENGAGKTAILDGIAAVLTPVLSQLSSANQRLSGPGIKDSDFRAEPWTDRTGRERWGVADFSQVIAEADDGLKWDYWKPSAAGKEPPEKFGQADLKHRLQRVIDSYRSSAPELTPVLAYYGAQRGYIKVPERLRGAKQAYDHPASALIGALDARSDFREMLDWFDVEEAAELRANKGIASSAFQESRALAAVRASIVGLLGGAFHNPYFNKDHKFVLEREKGGAPLLVSQLSQGYQSMLALAMDFSRRLAIANGHLPNAEQTGQLAPAMRAPGIMLVDEIDLHLHPSWQQRVLDDLMRSFPETQFIVTTHSPQVLTAVPSECIRILREGAAYAAPAGTEGAEPGRVLKTVLGLKQTRPPGNEATHELLEYLALVDQDRWQSPRALELRQRLDKRYQGNEPELLEADLRIENRKWELSA